MKAESCSPGLDTDNPREEKNKVPLLGCHVFCLSLSLS